MATQSGRPETPAQSRSMGRAILGSLGYVLFAIVLVLVLVIVVFVASFVVTLLTAVAAEDPEATLEAILEAMESGWFGVFSVALETAILGIATLVLARLSFDRNWVPRPAVGFSIPTGRQLLVGAVAVPVLVIVAYALEYLFTLVGVTASEHALMDMEFAPAHFFALVIVAIFLIGPVEELLFRGLIQNYVRPGLGTAGAIVWTSVLFAAIHVPSYYLLGLEAATASVVVVFVLSLAIGSLYERQRNVYVVMLVHGFYDAVLFAIVGLQALGAF